MTSILLFISLDDYDFFPDRLLTQAGIVFRMVTPGSEASPGAYKMPPAYAGSARVEF
jgi:hypothetical protein